MIPEIIPCLQNKDVYYVVDPSKSKQSCDVDSDFVAHFVMAASNDERHWGCNEFIKTRSTDVPMGIFVYGSPWKEADMMHAKAYIGLEDLSDSDISAHYRAVGGSVRAVQDYSPNIFQSLVENALATLTVRSATNLARGHCNFAFDPAAPSSKLVSVAPKETNSFEYDLSLTSDYVEEQLAAHFLRNSWYAVLDEANAGNRGNLFEAFVREKFSQAPADYAMCRTSLPSRPDGQGNTKKNYQTIQGGMSLGSRRKIVRVSDMLARVKATTDETEMFYSKNESEPLIDMIRRVSYGFEATQVTIRTEHDAGVAKIQALVNSLNLGATERLTIIYAVPRSRYDGSMTTPVNPLLDEAALAANVTIYHVAIDDNEN